MAQKVQTLFIDDLDDLDDLDGSEAEAASRLELLGIMRSSRC